MNWFGYFTGIVVGSIAALGVVYFTVGDAKSQELQAEFNGQAIVVGERFGPVNAFVCFKAVDGLEFPRVHKELGYDAVIDLFKQKYMEGKCTTSGAVDMVPEAILEKGIITDNQGRLRYAILRGKTYPIGGDQPNKWSSSTYPEEQVTIIMAMGKRIEETGT